MYVLLVSNSIIEYDERIRNGVINPRDPKENGTTGGTGPLNMDAACKVRKEGNLTLQTKVGPRSVPKA